MASPNPSPTETQSPVSQDSHQESVSDLFQKVSEQSSRLAQKEIELAKAEMSLKGKRIGTGAGAFGAAGVLGLLALGALTAAAILALATAVEDWLAAVIVAVVYLAIAGGLALFGRSKVKAGSPPVPEQTVESVKEDAHMTKEKAKEGRA